MTPLGQRLAGPETRGIAGDRASVNLNTLIDSRPFNGLQVRVAVLCGLVAVLDGIDTQSLAIAAPAVAQSLGRKVAELGPVFSITLLGGVTGALLCGSLADRLGRKRVLIAATTAFGLCTVMTAFTETWTQLLMTRFLTGLGLGGAVPCFLSLAGEYAPARRRGTLASLLWAGFPLGGMLGGFANAYVIGHFGWHVMFYLAGVLPMLVAATMILYLPESPAFLAGRNGRSDQVRRLAERVSGQDFAPGTEFFTLEEKVKGLPVGHLLTQGRAMGTALLWVAFAMAFGLLGLVVAWTAAVLQGVGLPLPATATVLGFHGLGSLIGTGMAGRLVDQFGGRRILVPSFLAAAASVWLLGVVTTVSEAALVMALVGFFLGGSASGMIALAARTYPTAMRSTGLGWSMGMGRLAQVFGPLVTGTLLVGGLKPSVMMQWLSFMPIVAAMSVLILPGRRAPAGAAADGAPGTE